MIAPHPLATRPPFFKPCAFNLLVASIKPPLAFLPLKSFLFTPEGSLILPAQIFEAYAFAYALGYTLNFLLAAAFPLGQSLVIISF